MCPLAVPPASLQTLAQHMHAVFIHHMPDVLLAIGGGGFIPARMLRTELKVPIVAISLELYDDSTNTASKAVIRRQWFDDSPESFGSLVRGRRVLIVDEVDDSRRTLQYAVDELTRGEGAPAAVGVFVVHNKVRTKEGTLPPSVTYIAGEDVPNVWNCYPWDARAYGRGIEEHEALARFCAGSSDSSAVTVTPPAATVGVPVGQLVIAFTVGVAAGALALLLRQRR